MYLLYQRKMVAANNDDFDKTIFLKSGCDYIVIPENLVIFSNLLKKHFAFKNQAPILEKINNDVQQENIENASAFTPSIRRMSCGLIAPSVSDSPALTRSPR